MAYVEIDELLVIDGVDEETAQELQARARDHIEAQNAKALEAAREAGLEDDLAEFEGLTPQMLEVLASDGVVNLKEFATCADWELAGGWSVIDGERVKDDGLLEQFGLSLEEARELVMTARVMLGWVTPEEALGQTDDEGGEGGEGGDGADRPQREEAGA